MMSSNPIGKVSVTRSASTWRRARYLFALAICAASIHALAKDQPDQYPIHQTEIPDFESTKSMIFDFESMSFRALSDRMKSIDDIANEVKDGDLCWDDAEGGAFGVLSKRFKPITVEASLGDDGDLQPTEYVLPSSVYSKTPYALLVTREGKRVVMYVVANEEKKRSIAILWAIEANDRARFEKEALPALVREVDALRRIARKKQEEESRIYETTLIALDQPNATVLDVENHKAIPVPFKRPSATEPIDLNVLLPQFGEYYQKLALFCDVSYETDFAPGIRTALAAHSLGKGRLEDLAEKQWVLAVSPAPTILLSKANPGTVVLFLSRRKHYVLAEIVARDDKSIKLRWIVDTSGKPEFKALREPKRDGN